MFAGNFCGWAPAEELLGRPGGMALAGCACMEASSGAGEWSAEPGGFVAKR